MANDPTQFNHQRLLDMVAAFEAELQKLPADAPEAQQLRGDIDRLKEHLSAAEPHPESVRGAWDSFRNSAQRTADAFENEVLKDSPYFTEMGRIIGLL